MSDRVRVEERPNRFANRNGIDTYGRIRYWLIIKLYIQINYCISLHDMYYYFVSIANLDKQEPPVKRIKLDDITGEISLTENKSNDVPVMKCPSLEYFGYNSPYQKKTDECIILLIFSQNPMLRYKATGRSEWNNRWLAGNGTVARSKLSAKSGRRTNRTNRDWFSVQQWWLVSKANEVSGLPWAKYLLRAVRFGGKATTGLPSAAWFVWSNSCSSSGHCHSRLHWPNGRTATHKSMARSKRHCLAASYRPVPQSAVSGRLMMRTCAPCLSPSNICNVINRGCRFRSCARFSALNSSSSHDRKTRKGCTRTTTSYWTTPRRWMHADPTTIGFRWCGTFGSTGWRCAEVRCFTYRQNGGTMWNLCHRAFLLASGLNDSCWLQPPGFLLQPESGRKPA